MDNMKIFDKKEEEIEITNYWNLQPQYRHLGLKNLLYL